MTSFEIMDKQSHFRLLTAVVLSLIFAGTAFGQNVPQKKTLVVNGRAAEGAVLQLDGHPYVDLDALARIMNATVKFETGRVILTVAAAEPDAKSARAAPGLSKGFAVTAVSQLAEMREWKAAIASAIRSGVAGGNWLAPWLHEYRLRAEGKLSQTSLAAKTESDRQALQLLKSDLANLGTWDSNTQATILSLNGEQTVNPAVAQNGSAFGENLRVRPFS